MCGIMSRQKQQENEKNEENQENEKNEENEENEKNGEKQTTNDYELIRLARIEENNKRMELLGVISMSKTLFAPQPKSAPNPNPRPRNPRTYSPASPRPTRKSTRLQSATPVSYSELPDEWERSPCRKQSVPVSNQPEMYTEEHEKLLGSCKKEWVLFQDGYGSNGKRIYDPINGKTCHQCRQKTLGLRTHCCSCQMVQGQFCGDCLYMRYGENVLEARENPDWICPVCRGICNCSLCRLKKGWGPTGSFYRYVKAEGYKSVAHYLILTKKAKKEPEQAHTDAKAEVLEVGTKRSLALAFSTEGIAESNCATDTKVAKKVNKLPNTVFKTEPKLTADVSVNTVVKTELQLTAEECVKTVAKTEPKLAVEESGNSKIPETANSDIPCDKMHDLKISTISEKPQEDSNLPKQRKLLKAKNIVPAGIALRLRSRTSKVQANGKL